MALVNGTPVIAMWTTTSSDRAGKYCGAAEIGSAASSRHRLTLRCDDTAEAER
ncbi:hypothetical protein IU498_23475 [Nocardia beijingensis]|uniref:hypothetical protein n=1 Tax=Nocardia beijingensis TaxID=95162 RepID=UPI0018950A6E|nr:hypothetical protein [Nocardia beijingensis]MBF6077590.1 hypothetical protein [Nocardia beijingensis]